MFTTSVFPSKANVHVMRDNPAHDIGMLGGTWGAKLTSPKIRKAWALSIGNMFRNKRALDDRKTAGTDQYLLNRCGFTTIQPGP
jgi:hypothetical protein